MIHQRNAGDQWILRGQWHRNLHPQYLCTNSSVKVLWDSILAVLDVQGDSCVCVVGDFNAIRREGGRVGRAEVVDSYLIRSFYNFIQSSNLIELPLIGRKFTCYRPDDTCKSKLERVFVNVELNNKWSNYTLKGLNRTLSDHCSIYLVGRKRIGELDRLDSLNAGYLTRGFIKSK